jgi:predicted PurR-regulated permease PerM
VCLALGLIWVVHPVIFVAFLGLLFGLAASAGVDRLERRRVPRGLAATLIIFGAVGLIVAFGRWMAPTLRRQTGELQAKIPVALDKLDDWLGTQESGPLSIALGRQRPVGAPSDTGIATSGAGVRQQGTEMRARILRQFAGAERSLFPYLRSTVAVVAGLFLLVFIALYVATDPDLYYSGVMRLVPHRARERTGAVLDAMAMTLRKWLLTQLLAMLIIGGATTALLLALHVRAAIALGVLTALSKFVPTIGAFLSGVPAVAMAFTDSPHKALLVGSAFLFLQLLENHLVIPLLMKRGVDLPPVLTLLAQAVMTVLFGFLGLLVSVPLLAVALVAVRMLYVEDVLEDRGGTAEC